MNKLYTATAVWAALGLLSGLYYREFTKAFEFDGTTQLATTHTHFLVLGVVFGLLFIILERLFQLTHCRLFPAFYWTWIVGTALTVGMQLIKGSLQVSGSAVADSPALAGIAGLGHITLTAMFIMFFLALRNRLKAAAWDATPFPPAAASDAETNRD